MVGSPNQSECLLMGAERCKGLGCGGVDVWRVQRGEEGCSGEQRMQRGAEGVESAERCRGSRGVWRVQRGADGC